VGLDSKILLVQETQTEVDQTPDYGRLPEGRIITLRTRATSTEASLPATAANLCYSAWPRGRASSASARPYEAFFQAMRTEAVLTGDACPSCWGKTTAPDTTATPTGTSGRPARVSSTAVGRAWGGMGSISFANSRTADETASAAELCVKPEEETAANFNPQRLRELIAGCNENW